MYNHQAVENAKLSARRAAERARIFCKEQPVNFSNQPGTEIYGRVQDGNLNGECVFRLKSGETYEGDVIAGQPHGFGVKTIPNGTMYEGEFRDGRPSGLGATYINEQGAWVLYYAGTFVNGVPHGIGVSYSGMEVEFRNGKLNMDHLMEDRLKEDYEMTSFWDSLINDD